MCGIIFALNSKGANPIKADDYMRDAFLASQVRGTDGAGLFQVDRDGKITWHKAGSNASEFVALPEAKKNLLAANSLPITVGHVRAATQGIVSTENAHPFCITREDGTSVVGVHNGTIFNWRNKEDADNFKVDSEWIFHMIAKHGVDAFKHFEGAYALVWYDDLYPGKILMTRNKDRPLHYMLTQDRKTMFGASEVGMLGWCTQRNSFYPKTGETCFYLEPDKIYIFDLEKDVLGGFETIDRPKYDWSTGYPRGRSAYASGYESRSAGSSTAVTTYDPPGPKDRDIFDDDDEPWYGATGYDYNYSDQEHTLNGVKEALRQARNQTAGSGMGNNSDVAVIDVEPIVVGSIVDSDALERAMHKAIIQQNAESGVSANDAPFRETTTSPLGPNPIDRSEFYITTARGSAASRGEIRAAKDAKLFGLVVKFKGLEYDEDTNTCIGTADVVINGNTRTLDGEIRFIPEQVAWDLFINRNHGLATLIGLRISENWAVFEMPDPAQRRHIVDTVAAMRKRMMN
jgi:hypothetical protein